VPVSASESIRGFVRESPQSIREAERSLTPKQFRIIRILLALGLCLSNLREFSSAIKHIWDDVHILAQILGANLENTVTYLHHVMRIVAVRGPFLELLASNIPRDTWEKRFSSLDRDFEVEPREIAKDLMLKAEKKNEEGKVLWSLCYCRYHLTQARPRVF
jgi:hypothetical protein